MKMFYTRLTRGKDIVELVGEATTENVAAAADTARQLMAEGWTPVPKDQLAAEARTAAITEPGYHPTMQ